MVKKKTFIRICIVIMAIAALSLLSLTAFAAAEDDGNTAAEYQTLSSSSSSRSPGKIIAVTLGVSVVGTGLAVWMVYKNYKFNGKTEPYLYNKKAPLDLVEAEDIHVDTQVERRRRERSND